MVSKKQQYDSVLNLFFRTVIPSVKISLQRQPTGPDFNRLRKMCKVFGPETVQSAIMTLQDLSDSENAPEFRTMTDAINYLYGIAKKNVILDRNPIPEIDKLLDEL